MRVKISYNLDIDDIPNELRKVLEKTLKTVSNIKRDLENVLCNIDDDSSLILMANMLENTRLKVGDVDISLHDWTNIATGYIKAKNSEYLDEDVSCDVPEQGGENEER